MANSNNITIIVRGFQTVFAKANDQFEQVREFKYLGILVDSKVMWRCHITKLHAEIRKCDVTCQVDLFLTSVRAWVLGRGAYDIWINTIPVTQKYFVRIIYLRQHDHTDKLLFNLHVLAMKISLFSKYSEHKNSGFWEVRICRFSLDLNNKCQVIKNLFCKNIRIPKPRRLNFYLRISNKK